MKRRNLVTNLNNDKNVKTETELESVNSDKNFYSEPEFKPKKTEMLCFYCKKKNHLLENFFIQKIDHSKKNLNL